MTTERERHLIASVQDRMLREADADPDDGRTCGTCGSFDHCPHRSFDGEVYDRLSVVGICDQLDIVCDEDAPACERWEG